MSAELVAAAVDLGFQQVTYHQPYEPFSDTLSVVENGQRRLVTDTEMASIEARAIEMQP